MARIRTIKPEFWTDGRMVKLSPWARLFYIGSWNFTTCDRGHLPDDPDGLKLQILPADDVDPVALLDELLQLGRIVRLRGAGGRTYLHVRRFEDHQKLEKRWTPRCPACNDDTLEEQEPPLPTSPKLPGTRASLREHAETPRNSPELPEPLPRTGQEGTGQEGTGQVPPSAGAAIAIAEPGAQGLIAEWIDHLPGGRPPGRLIGQVAKELGAMLAEGIPYADVRNGLAAWQGKGLHPSALASVVHETRTPRTTTGGSARKQEGDRILREAMAQAQEAERNAS